MEVNMLHLFYYLPCQPKTYDGQKRDKGRAISKISFNFFLKI